MVQRNRRRGTGSGRRFYSDSYLAGPWGAILFVGIMVAVAYGVIQLIKKADESAEADKKQAASRASLGGKSGSGGPRFSSGSGEPRKGNATSTTPTPPRASVQQAVNELNVAVVSREVRRGSTRRLTPPRSPPIRTYDDSGACDVVESSSVTRAEPT